MQKRKGGGGSNWMDTYGDMVTLLLCFFVLLYSISSIDETKYMAVMKSFNPEAIETDLDEGGTKGPIDSDGKNDIEDEENISQADVDQALEALYQELKDYAAASNSAKNIEITKGDGYVFVSFDDAVFFDGDSFALRPQGEQVLGDISGIFNKVAQYIDEIRIMGHTAQARADRPNDVTADRFWPLTGQRLPPCIFRSTVIISSRQGLSALAMGSTGRWIPMIRRRAAATTGGWRS